MAKVYMKAPREHWYDGIAEAVMTYIPGSATYKTMLSIYVVLCQVL